MNTPEWNTLEERLRVEPLRAPSADLDRRVGAVFQRTPAVARRWTIAAVVALASAACLAVIVIGGRGALDRPAEAAIEPNVEIEQVWSTVTRREIVSPDDGPAMQRAQRQVVRHVRWVDDRNRVHIEWNIPSEQSVLVPLEYN